MSINKHKPTLPVINSERNTFSPALPNLSGSNQQGETLHFSNHFMMLDDKPIFGICGEFHFSRYDSEKWNDELIKMKMAGITIVPTYVIWNHHEEIKGSFNWTGSKSIRRFVELCKKHDLQTILRIGPFAHGEVRNGGLPDWIYGEPCRIRSNDPQYIKYVDRWYGEISEQVEGLFFKEDGPIIAIQLENEFYHSAAPWEISTGTSNEWLTSGEDGEAHIFKLKDIAKEKGLITPFYTGTGWGGALAPTSEVLPLWGGYAFWPWIFYDESVKEHPVTPEFIYRDFNKPTYNFEPAYDPQTIPFACCEMGGGMTVFYKYRFKLPFQSVEAMANIKVAGGCNFVGYYVFHGGSNPKGTLTPFLNENATPKISYDYQAPIGEFGQIRESYKRLKRQHYFYKTFQETFCKTTTVLPYNTDDMDPKDVDTLRYAFRVNEGKGFVFLNNYQDHLESPTKENVSLEFQVDDQLVRIPHEGGFTLESEVSCILPFNFEMENEITLEYATAQLIDMRSFDEKDVYYFFHPSGMKPSYRFKADQISEIHVSHGEVKDEGTHWTIYPTAEVLTKITILNKDQRKTEIFTMTHEQSIQFWSFEWENTHHAVISEATILVEQDQVRFETELETIQVSIIDGMASPSFLKSFKQESVTEILEVYSMNKTKHQISSTITELDDSRLLVSIPTDAFDHVKELILNIEYEGDMGYAFINNELIHDNFNNGEAWQIGLSSLKDQLKDEEIYIKISPIKIGREVKSDSPMAARNETSAQDIAKINKVSFTPVYEFNI